MFNGGVAAVQLPFEGGLSNRNLATFVNTDGEPIVEGKSFISFTTMNNGVAWVVEPDGGIMMLKDNGKIDDRTFVEMDLLKAYPFFENKAVVKIAIMVGLLLINRVIICIILKIWLLPLV